MSEQTARFERLVERIGLVLAAIVAKDSLPADFFKKLAFGNLLEIYRVAKDDPEFQAVVLRKIRDTSESFDVVAKALPTATDDKLRLVLQRRLINTAKTFGHYQVIFEAGPDTKYGKMAFQRLCRLATTKQGKQYVSKSVDKRSALYVELMFALERTAQSFADEYFVWSLNKSNKLGERAFKRMMRVGTFGDWLGFLGSSENIDNCSPTTLFEIFGRCMVLAGDDFEKLLRLAKAIAERDNLCRAIGGSTMVSRLHNNLIASASTSEELEKVYFFCHESMAGGHCVVIAKRLMAEVTTLQELRLLFNKIPESGALVLNRMREFYAKEG